MIKDRHRVAPPFALEMKMKPPRITIGGLLVVILLVALGLAAWMVATPALDSAVFGSVMLTLLGSVLLAVHRVEASRAYWLGFALFGWTYLVLGQFPAIEAKLPTTAGLEYLDSLRPGQVVAFTIGMNVSGGGPGRATVQVLSSSASGVAVDTSRAGVVRISDPSTGRAVGGVGDPSEFFVRTGHSLLALAMAFIGAVASRHLHDWERRREAPASAQETSTSSPTS